MRHIVESQSSSSYHIHRIVGTNDDAAIPIFRATRDHLLVPLRHQDGQKQSSRVAVSGVAAWIRRAIDQVHNWSAIVYRVAGGNIEVVGADN